MQVRTFGRSGWPVSELGYGMWGMGGWTGSDDEESLASLQAAVDRGCTFFDTAWVYGDGRSERLLGRLLAANPRKSLYTASKVPPKNRIWPSRPEFPLADCYPASHVAEYLEQTLDNTGLETIDLMQFHTWDDHWVDDPALEETVRVLRDSRKVRAVGISLNRRQPSNGIRAVEAGWVDAVQVVYNVFDQSPEDALFPACRKAGAAVIARVPFDEGSLTGMLNPDSRWPEGDFRNGYFNAENLARTLPRVAALEALVPDGGTLAEMALRWILSNPDVATVIPGMRKLRNVEANVAAANAGPLDPPLYESLRAHRWDR